MERRTVLELITLYELEPSIRDIYVEGPTDRAFIVSVLTRLQYGSDVQVREIDVIDIPEEALRSQGLEIGARQRIIALAFLLERDSAIDLRPRVICIADADDEAGRTPRAVGALLIYTDATSLPIYAFEPQYIQWYVGVETLGFPLTGEEVIESLIPILRIAACARRSLKTLNISCSLVDLTRDCALSGTSPVFDSARFTQRLLNKANAFARKREFEDALQAHGAALDTYAHRKFWVHSEDFSSLLHWLIVELRGSYNTVAQHLLSRTLLLSIPLEDVLGWPLFKEILTRFPRDFAA